MQRLITALALMLTLVAGPLFAQDTPPADQTEAQAKSDLDLLIGVIEDDAARAALVEKLREAGAEAEPTTPDDIVETLADGTPPPDSLSFGRRIALITQNAAEGLAASVSTVWTQATSAPGIFDGLSGNEVEVLLDALKDLALVIVVTVAIFFVLRRGGKSIYARMGASARDSGPLRTIVLFIFSAIIDALIVVVAWAVGYAVATLVLGNFGQIGIRQTLYLNAFLLVEMAKVMVRLVLSPSAADLRLVQIGDRSAKYLATWLNLIIGIIGYGQLLVVPIINANVSFPAGRAVSSLIAFVVLALAIWLVLRNKTAVADWMEGTGPETPADAQTVPAAEASAGLDPEVEPVTPAPAPRRRTGALHFLARHWHWPVMLYLLAMFVIVLVRPGDAAFRAFVASGKVAIVALIGLAVSGLITRAMRHGVILPENVNARLPLLERRLNRFVPRALFVLRLVIVFLVVVMALDAINAVDLRAWLASQVGLRLTGVILSVASVLIVSFAVWIGLTSWVDYRLNPEFGQVATAREKTLLTLLRNAATIALIIITLMFVLSEIGLDIAPLLASAGVLGLAIGFGAQKMVQDIITGIFIQFENAMNVGDVVTVGGTTGTVERLTIRSVSLRDLTGAYHLIPFSSVDMVTNYVRDFGYFVCDMGVAYRESVDDVKQAMLDAFEELRADPAQADGIMGDMEWFGLNSFGDSAVNVRARIKCIPGRQWGIGRAYNEVLKRVFDDRNIEIPFPHQTIYWGESKDGKTQTVKVDVEGTAPPALTGPTPDQTPT